MKSKDLKFGCTTTITGDLIEQVHTDLSNDIKYDICKRTIDTADRQVKAALMELGWTPPEEQWISVKEALPKVGQSVYYYFEMFGVIAGYYDGDNRFSSRRGWLQHDVTFWMPRHEPNPPY